MGCFMREVTFIDFKDTIFVTFKNNFMFALVNFQNYLNMRKLKFLVGLVCLSIIAISCSKEETENESSEEVQARISSRVDEAADDITRIVLYQFDIQSTHSGSSAFVPYTPPGVTVTETNTAASWNKVISFRTTGVTIPSGNVLKGVVVLSGAIVGGTPSNTINCTFNNFYHNNYKITGTYTIVITNVSTPLLSTVHPVATATTNLTITKGSSVYQRNGTRICEQTAGASTQNNWLDNIYKIRGNWTTTIAGVVRTSNVTTPLVASGICGYINTGIVTTTSTSGTTILNFGSGTCDNLATLTISGRNYTISLGN
jgi:hypothetical protein